MSLISLCILASKEGEISIAHILYDTSKFSFIGIETIKEFISFGFIEVATRSEIDKRMVLSTSEYGGILFNVLLRGDGIGVGVLTNQTYPKNTITYIIHRSFEVFYERGEWNELTQSFNVEGTIQQCKTELKYLFEHFGRERNMELSKEEMIKNELDEINEKMGCLITKLVSREEDLADVVTKSEVLSERSKKLYKRTKKAKRCHVPCVIL
ncbi:hypothetical protein EIN_390920 [Entamoeba invadens IP1]|uniref:V-SNARE coiled-coil homology domain-containing protein n=1 Tax=Entamoeba invadens IP1 TaxID=370355 RepID=A0A0A1U5G2_ENTIV|nr:hypothetical protein EIN_390920 [Entamoeba invadens IP1]ELP89467.1 hypothetical protein EIN_390920 [Entamoeba invadens IP1]|eukprot:XP_004256238.1 hypothetical protein EIN_390920 [Entamoeba invadens IP1]